MISGGNTSSTKVSRFQSFKVSKTPAPHLQLLVATGREVSPAAQFETVNRDSRLGFWVRHEQNELATDDSFCVTV